MAGEPSTGVKFFHVSSRLNRLRYFSYSVTMAWASLPVTVAGLYLRLHQGYLAGDVLSFASDIFFVPIQFTFMIRRLHDIGRSGWWSLIYAILLPFLFLAAHKMMTPGMTVLFLILMLINLGFFLMLTFASGTPGENRFGTAPPPNGPWVVIMGWSGLLLLLVSFVLVIALGISVAGRVSSVRSNYAVNIARASTEQARLYHEENHEWPTDIGNIAGTNPGWSRYYRISSIKYPDGSYGIIVTRGTGPAVEMWTTDGGESWHCGPAYADPMPKESLPDNCQEDSPPVP